MTPEQKYKLNKAIELIRDSIESETNNRILSVWLLVAGDYCNEIAEEILILNKKVKQ